MVWRVSFPRCIRVRLIGTLLLALLFSQLAVAAYACPAHRAQSEDGPATMVGMPCAAMTAAAAELDPDQPVLCLQHCQFGAASCVADQVLPALAHVTAFPALFTVALDAGRHGAPETGAERERLRHRPPPLAHTLAHCCFRL